MIRSLLLLGLLLWPSLALGLGAPSNPDHSFSFVMIGETQNRLDTRNRAINSCTVGQNPLNIAKPQANAFGLGDLKVRNTDIGWAHQSRTSPRSDRIYSDRTLFVTIPGDLQDRSNEIANAWATFWCGPASGTCFQGDCEGFANFPYVFQERGVAPLIDAGMCVLAPPGNHDLNCGRANSKRLEDTPNDCTNGVPALLNTNEVAYSRWVDNAPHTWMRRSCPNYDDDFLVADQFLTSTHPGAGLGLNQRTIKRVGSQDILILSMNMEPTATEWTWISGQLAANLTTPTIIITHAVVDNTGTAPAALIMNTQADCATCMTIDAVLDDIQLNYPNVFFVGGGHFHGTSPCSYGCSGFYDLTMAKRDHLKVGDTDKDMSLFTCNWQNMNGEASLMNCIITVQPALDRLCWEVVLPGWAADAAGAPRTQYTSHTLAPNTNMLGDDSVRLDLFDRTGLVPASGCQALNWVGTP